MATYSAYDQRKGIIICGVASWPRGISHEKAAQENGSPKKAQWLLKQNGFPTVFIIAQGFEGFEECWRSTARRKQVRQSVGILSTSEGWVLPPISPSSQGHMLRLQSRPFFTPKIYLPIWAYAFSRLSSMRRTSIDDGRSVTPSHFNLASLGARSGFGRIQGAQTLNPRWLIFYSSILSAASTSSSSSLSPITTSPSFTTRFTRSLV